MLYPKVCRIRSETVRLGSFDRPKYLDPNKKARGSKKYFGDFPLGALRRSSGYGTNFTLKPIIGHIFRISLTIRYVKKKEKEN
jgi:hypothetical protein